MPSPSSIASRPPRETTDVFPRDRLKKASRGVRYSGLWHGREGGDPSAARDPSTIRHAPPLLQRPDRRSPAVACDRRACRRKGRRTRRQPSPDGRGPRGTRDAHATARGDSARDDAGPWRLLGRSGGPECRPQHGSRRGPQGKGSRFLPRPDGRRAPGGRSPDIGLQLPRGVRLATRRIGGPWPGGGPRGDSVYAWWRLRGRYGTRVRAGPLPRLLLAGHSLLPNGAVRPCLLRLSHREHQPDRHRRAAHPGDDLPHRRHLRDGGRGGGGRASRPLAHGLLQGPHHGRGPARDARQPAEPGTDPGEPHQPRNHVVRGEGADLHRRRRDRLQRHRRHRRVAGRRVHEQQQPQQPGRDDGPRLRLVLVGGRLHRRRLRGWCPRDEPHARRGR